MNADLLPYKPRQVDIDISEPVVTEEEAHGELKQLLADVGVKLQRNRVVAMRKVGVHLRSIGVLHYVRGDIAVSLEEINHAIELIVVAMDKAKPAMLCRLTAQLGFLMKCKADAHEVLVSMERLLTPTVKDENEQTNTGFTPGTKVMPPSTGTLVLAQNVTMNQPQEKTLQNPSNGQTVRP